MAGAYSGVHSETADGGGGLGWGGRRKRDALIERSGVERRKIDDLMEVWRQWVGRRGIWEADGEGQNEIGPDGRWIPTLHVSA